jgi:hypothetical protein
MNKKKEEKLKQEKELQGLRERTEARFPVGATVRYNSGHGWYHARVEKYDKLAAIVKDYGKTNSHRIEFAALDEPMWTKSMG